MRQIFLLFILFPTILTAGNLDRIRKAILKQEFEKAYELIEKVREKEPDNPGVDYYAALLFFNENQKRYNLDSARSNVIKALKKYESVDAKLKEELSEDGVTHEEIIGLSDSIRDRTYSNTIDSLSVKRAELFMNLYPESPYQQRLIFQRDSMVFIRVKENDSLGLYQHFLDQYSTPEFRERAIRRIDELRYQVLSHTGSLDDYYTFLKKYPETKFREEIEKFIFVRSNADHRLESYSKFVDFAQSDNLKKKAADLAYYLAKENRKRFFHPLSDSIEEVEQRHGIRLLPAIDRNEFGFYTQDGKLQIPHAYENASDSYKCRITTDDLLFVSKEGSGRLIDRNGSLVVDEVEDYQDLGSAAVKVLRKGQWFLYHKSGSMILSEPIKNAEVLNRRWLKIMKNKKWALVSFSGFDITKYEFDDIYLVGPFWVFEKAGLLAVYTEDLIENELGEDGLELEFKFDDIELIDDDRLIGFRRDRESMLDRTLSFLIPWGEYEINPDESGWYLKTDEGYRLYNKSEQDIMNQVHPFLETNLGWLAIETDTDWMLLPKQKGIFPSRGYDSLKLINENCVYQVKDSLAQLLFSNGTSFELIENQIITAFQGRQDYILVSSEDKRSVFNFAGEQVVTGNFDEISFFSDTLLSISQEGKHGLLTLSGEYLIEPLYDAIDNKDDMVLMLKDGKIGCLDLISGKTLSPNYDSRIERLSDFYLVRKDGYYGVIRDDEETIISFMYDEIKLWNDTSFVARELDEWIIVNHEDEEIGEPMTFLSIVSSNENESFWKYVLEGKYGLISNKRGVLLNHEFTDIFNIGTDEDPVFFADQHLRKAGFHVVSYINRDGELILSKAYTGEEFDKILCED